MKNILFVCTGNSCRSVMAEGLFKKITEPRAGDFSVGSAGISAVDGFPASQETIRAMREVGIDVSGHRGRQLTTEMIRQADRIFVMERLHKDWILNADPKAREKVFMLTEFATHREAVPKDIDIPDPIRMSDHFYKHVLEAIRDCVKRVAETL